MCGDASLYGETRLLIGDYGGGGGIRGCSVGGDGGGL